MEPVKKVIKVLTAEYSKQAESIAILGECSEGRLRTQIHMSNFSFGRRTEEEIDYEMRKTAHLMVGKKITFVFDPDLEDKMKDNQRLNY